MSLVEMIFSRTEVVVGLAAATLLMALALLLVAFNMLRSRAKAPAQPVPRLIPLRPGETLPPDLTPTRVKSGAEATVAGAASIAPTTPTKPVSPAPIAPPPIPVTPPAETPAPVPDAVQDILSSVFSEEEAAAYYAVLLKGVDEVSAEALATQGAEILAKLRAMNGSPA